MAKAQTAMEFVILVGTIMFFIISFLFYLQSNFQESSQERVSFLLMDTALSVQGEINLAVKSVDGYSRNFVLPQDIMGHDYQIQIEESLIYIRTTDGRNALSFSVNNVTGNVQKGENIIKKIDGAVYINP